MLRVTEYFAKSVKVNKEKEFSTTLLTLEVTLSSLLVHTQYTVTEVSSL